MKSSGQSLVFGRRKEPHTVIIARGNEIRHFTIRPWMAAFVGSAIFAVVIGYLLATTYLVLRDDLIGAAAARQARLQQSYEDRISTLRAQVDRITSRQMLDQQLMESKVAELLERQSQLSLRHGRLGPILERAENASGALPGKAPVPADRPGRIERGAGAAMERHFSTASASPAPSQFFSFWNTREALSTGETTADRADRLFVALNRSLRAIETEQLDRISTLAANANQAADAIADALGDAGLEVDNDYGNSAIGGPLVAIDNSAVFDHKVRELDQALAALDQVKREARRLPIANPAPGKPITSGFGVRKDPLLGIRAMHAGMDFRGQVGEPVRVTAAGTVVKARWNGGYGRMVEVDHGNGFSTRYAHMSRIAVREGQKVDTGTVVGNVGSSGRSTGPHLHYEIRRNGDPLDPSRFISAGRKVVQFL